MPAARPASAAPALGGSSQLPAALRGFPTPATFAEAGFRPHSAPQAMLHRTQGASGVAAFHMYICICTRVGVHITGCV